MTDQDRLVSYAEKFKKNFSTNPTQKSLVEPIAVNCKKQTYDLPSETRSIQSYKPSALNANAKTPFNISTNNTITISPNEKKSCEINLIKKVDGKKSCNVSNDIEKKTPINNNHNNNKLSIQISRESSTNCLNLKSTDTYIGDDRCKKDRNSINNVKENLKMKKRREINKSQTKGPFELVKETVINGRFVVKEKLGAGGCGAVYRCFDNMKKVHVALKAEKNRDDKGCVLKFEVKVLQHLDGKKNVVQLISSGKKEMFSWVALTLLGYNLYDLRKACDSFSYSTIARIGIQILYALKEVHEAGFIHRDVKPQNMAIGGTVTTMKIIHLLDFGLSRGFIIINNDVPIIREKRKVVLFRGTSRYCSINAQKNMEQGRHDDLWSLLYVLSEFVHPLPWAKLGRDKVQILKIKEITSTRDLFPKFPQMEIISDYLETLNYYSKPKYGTIYNVLKNMLLLSGGYMSDMYDWEIEGVVKLPKEYISETNNLRLELDKKNSTTSGSSPKNVEEEKIIKRSKNSEKNNSVYNILNNLNEFYVYERFATSQLRF
uniref:Protein kinase domain-containing protein n=1 Tax=Strongyloides stercoralis TaxID=6248 RepID=A0A0K0EFB1_STRER